MELNGELIDAIAVQPHRCKQPGYLDAMRRCLKIKHQERLQNTQEPCFYLQVPSSMNGENEKA